MAQQPRWSQQDYYVRQQQLRLQYQQQQQRQQAWPSSNGYQGYQQNQFPHQPQQFAFPALQNYMQQQHLQPQVLQPEVPMAPKPRRTFKDPLVPLIAEAIVSSEERRLPLGELYTQISVLSPVNYPAGNEGWHNNVRYTLSHYAFFVKGGRVPTGRGNYWAIHEACYDQFAGRDFSIKKARLAVKAWEKARDAAKAEAEAKAKREAELVAEFQAPLDVMLQSKQSS